MMKKRLYQSYCFAALVIFCFCGLFPAAVHAEKFKVLAVMSYEETMPWNHEIKEGIDKVLADTCEVKYFYMDTKINLAGGPQKAEEAYALYQEYQPDGIIVADDNAQSMFVVKYLKDKVKTPIMFCGVNADPEKYGYPADHISGILERHHFRGSIALAQQLVPSIKSFGYMIKKSPVGDLIIKQIQKEAGSYSAAFIDSWMPETKQETVKMVKELRDKCDFLIISTMTGTLDDDGKTLTDKEMVPLIVKTFGKPVIGTEEQVVMSGALCSVLRTGQEQGGTAAEMLLKAMNGTPVSQIPVVQNHNGKRIINITTMKEMGIKPNPVAIKGAQLVKTEK